MTKELKTPIAELAAKFKAEMVLDETTGVISIADGAYLRHAPAEVTEASIKKIQDYNTQVLAATGQAVSELTQAQVEAKSPLFNVEGARQIEFSLPLVGKDSMSHVALVNVGEKRAEMVSNFTVWGAGATRGELKKVHDLFSAAIGQLLAE